VAHSILSDAPLRAALGSAGQQLQRLDHTGYGDVTYWRLRARRFAETVRNAGQQLDSVAASVTPAQTVSLRTALVALAEAAYGMSSQGQGDVGYWRRATRNLALLGAGFGRGIKIIAGETGSPLSAILGSMANQLTRLSYDGYGDVHYWLAKASGVADQIRSQATVLVDTANGID